MHRPAGLRAQDARAPGDAAMSAKADEACNAPYGERDEGRVNSRNGYRERGLSTAAGDVTLKIPKLRRGSFFPEDLIERYCRVDRALVAAVAEMYAMGISTRKVEAVAGELGVRSMSKSQVSRLCEVLDAEVAAFRRQRFQIGELNASIEDSLLGQRVVKAFAAEEEENKKVRAGQHRVPDHQEENLPCHGRVQHLHPGCFDWVGCIWWSLWQAAFRWYMAPSALAIWLPMCCMFPL